MKILGRAILVALSTLVALPDGSGADQRSGVVKRISREPSEEPQVREPLDLLDHLPLLSRLRFPRMFLLDGGYVIKLNTDNMVIDHMVSAKAIPPSKRNALISLSYGSRFGGSFSSQVDVPVMYAPSLGLLGWKISPFGDYTARFGSFSPTSTTRSENSSSISLQTHARF